MGLNQNESTSEEVKAELGRLLEVGKLLASVLTDEEKESLQLFWSKNGEIDILQKFGLGNTSVT